jgi:hypothetical protein
MKKDKLGGSGLVYIDIWQIKFFSSFQISQACPNAIGITFDL